jgi:pimeloyl-ACP methyl ester carboxylesterase
MQLEYFISGETNKETILFVHGAGANASQFEKQLDFFSERYKVVSLSLRGHGGSPLPSPNITPLYSLDHNANDIIELIENLKLDNIHFVGNSTGGVLGYIVCTRMADRFLSLTTFGTTGQMTLPAWSAGMVSAYDAFMIRLFRKKYLAFTAGYAVKNKQSKEKVFRMFLKAADAIPHLRAHLVNYNFLEEIEGLTIPYNLMQCEYDNDINKSLKTTLEAMSKNNNAKVVHLQGAGHIANLDAPDEFNRVLLDLLVRLNSTRKLEIAPQVSGSTSY